MTIRWGESVGVNTVLLVICGCLTFRWELNHTDATRRTIPEVVPRYAELQYIGADPPGRYWEQTRQIRRFWSPKDASPGKAELIIWGEYLPHIILANPAHSLGTAIWWTPDRQRAAVYRKSTDRGLPGSRWGDVSKPPVVVDAVAIRVVVLYFGTETRLPELYVCTRSAVQLAVADALEGGTARSHMLGRVSDCWCVSGSWCHLDRWSGIVGWEIRFPKLTWYRTNGSGHEVIPVEDGRLVQCYFATYRNLIIIYSLCKTLNLSIYPFRLHWPHSKRYTIYKRCGVK